MSEEKKIYSARKTQTTQSAMFTEENTDVLTGFS